MSALVRYIASFAISRSTIKFRVRSFGMIWIRINDPRSIESCFMKGTDESVTRVDSSIHLMYHDLSDLGSLIQINLKERTLSYIVYQTDPQKQKKKENSTLFRAFSAFHDYAIFYSSLTDNYQNYRLSTQLYTNH